MKREKLKAKTRASYDATQACTLKRVEVNLCYEVGITQFARISRFLFSWTLKCSKRSRDDTDVKLQKWDRLQGTWQSSLKSSKVEPKTQVAAQV